MKIGDKVVCVNAKDMPNELGIIHRGRELTEGMVYVITGISPYYGGLKVDKAKAGKMSSGYFQRKRFRKIDGFTNALTKELAEDFIEKDGIPQIERIKIFTTEAKF